MALDRLLATGSANLAMRISIEGLSVEVVSDPAMEKTLADGRRRVYCIDDIGGGLIIDETVNLPEAKLEGQGASVTFFETKAEDLSQVFFYRPSLERYLTANAAAADTALTLQSTDGIAANDVIHIGTEALKVGTVASPTSLTGCTRSYWGTTAQKHWAGGELPVRLVANRPTKIRGRRVRVYLYEDGNDPQGDGTQVFLGQVESDPACDEAGTKWRLQIGSIVKRLESKVGGDLEAEARPRGIYYSAGAGLFIRLEETVAGVERKGTGTFTGFYETQREFLVALQVALNTEGTGARLH